MCAGTHTWSRAECVSCSSLWQRVFAVWTLHCSLSSHTAWPSNTAFQWWLWKWAHRFNKLFISVNTNPGAKKKEVRVVTLLSLNVFLGPDCGDRCRNEHVVNLLTDMWFFLFWRQFFVRTFWSWGSGLCVSVCFRLTITFVAATAVWEPSSASNWGLHWTRSDFWQKERKRGGFKLETLLHFLPNTNVFGFLVL